MSGSSRNTNAAIVDKALCTEEAWFAVAKQFRPRSPEVRKDGPGWMHMQIASDLIGSYYPFQEIWWRGTDLLGNSYGPKHDTNLIGRSGDYYRVYHFVEYLMCPPVTEPVQSLETAKAQLLLLE